VNSPLFIALTAFLTRADLSALAIIKVGVVVFLEDGLLPGISVIDVTGKAEIRE
jgi:hypothetical protein